VFYFKIDNAQRLSEKTDYGSEYRVEFQMTLICALALAPLFEIGSLYFHRYYLD